MTLFYSFCNPDFTSILLVIRASVPKLQLDDVFLQKNDIAKGVEDELEKVILLFLFVLMYFRLERVKEFTVLSCFRPCLVMVSRLCKL